MNDAPPPLRSISRYFTPPVLAALALLLLVFVTMGSVLHNAYVQDDYGIILGNENVRTWSGIWRAFTLPYWPGESISELYRPLTIAWFTPQWQLGHGSPVVFRAVTLALYAVAVFSVWRLLRLLVPATPAWIGAAVFAVHPVHVEAVTVAVNQSELIVGALLAFAVELRIRANRGQVSRSGAGRAILGLFLVGLFTKEHALVLPGLLLAADQFLDRDATSLRDRLRAWRWNYLALVAIAAFFWTIRTVVLGAGSGTAAAEALAGAGMLQRAHTMVGVPAEWLRLLLWPAHLQADWNLIEWIPARGWTLRETAGLAAIIAFLAALAAAWRRRPVAAFGLAWMLVALAPVSNVLIPSGIILAERTLFLTTIGFVLVLADLSGMVVERWDGLSRPLRLVCLVGGTALLGLGILRSRVRVEGWSTRPIFLAVEAADAPLSWRTHLAYGLVLAEAGDTAAARLEIRTSIAIRPDDPLISKSLIDRIRTNRGECAGASIAYQEMLRRFPRRSDARGSLVACLLFLGRYAEGREEADRGVASRLDTALFGSFARTADSALRVGAAAGTVRLPPVPGKATAVGDPHHPDSTSALP